MKEFSNETTPLNELFSKVAESIFNSVSPSVLLIGSDDSKFERIRHLYTWAKWHKECPKEITQSTQIVITNTKKAYLDVINQNLNQVSHLAYLEDIPMPLDMREKSKEQLTSFVHPISEKYITSHIRILLQIQAHRYCSKEEVPVFLSSAEKMDAMIGYLTEIDKNPHYVTSVSDSDYFKKLYRCFSKQTKHKESKIVDMSKTKGSSLLLKDETIIVFAKTEKELNTAKKRFSDHRGSVGYIVINAEEESGWIKNKLELKFDIAEAYLIASYLSIKNNTLDGEGKTRFLQKSTIEKVYENSSGYNEFCKGIELSLIHI